MAALSASGFLEIGADRLEYRHLGPQPADAPAIVLLHEGLGSADLWADLPQRLAATGLGVLAFSRRGYGNSSPRELPWPFAYMHEEAREVLPRVLDAIGFKKGFLVGASDGASIATVYAGAFDDARVRGVTLIAPHFIVEDQTENGALTAKAGYEQGDLKPKLARWHRNVDIAFYGWNLCWTNKEFKRTWDITEFLPRIRCPVQILQGERDDYGTIAQIELARRYCRVEVEATMMPRIGHSIFRDDPEATTAAIADFVKRRL